MLLTGAADSLTSRPINLFNYFDTQLQDTVRYTEADSVYLSFFTKAVAWAMHLIHRPGVDSLTQCSSPPPHSVIGKNGRK